MQASTAYSELASAAGGNPSIPYSQVYSLLADAFSLMAYGFPTAVVGMGLLFIHRR